MDTDENIESLGRKPCPYCKKQLTWKAVWCPFCGEEIPDDNNIFRPYRIADSIKY